MPVEVVSRFPEIVAVAQADAERDVATITQAVEDGARRHLVARGSVRSGLLLGSVSSGSEGLEGEISAGDGLPDARAVYVELGTGVRGAAYEFPGKPAGITYDVSWTRGIPKDPAHGFAYLIPALEEQRESFEAHAGEWYR